MITFEQHEKILYTIRKHWFVILLDALSLALFILVPLGIFFLVRNADRFLGAGLSDVAFSAQTLNTPLIIFFGSLWVLIVWTRFLVQWTDFYLDAWYITNKRIVDVEQKGFFKREVASLHFDRIQDVTIEVNGILATLLNFGDLHVQTAGEMREFIIRGIPHPYKVKERVNKELEKAFQDFHTSTSGHGI